MKSDKSVSDFVLYHRKVTRRKKLTGDEASILLQTVSEYVGAMDLLDDYDHQRITVGKVSKRQAKPVSYKEAIKVIDVMRQKFGDSAMVTNLISGK